VTPRRLLLDDQAARDIAARARILRQKRGPAFTRAWVDTLLAWLNALAEGGAVLGTAHPEDPTLRVFGYRRQASVLAEFVPGELRVIRVYFRGQDWSRL
jgi:plasmid stabilization system protein ParE